MKTFRSQPKIKKYKIKIIIDISLLCVDDFKSTNGGDLYMSKIMKYGDYIDYIKHLDPIKLSRTITRNVGSYGSAIEVKLCRTRRSATKQVRAQEKKPYCFNNWRAAKPLADWEGFI